MGVSLGTLYGESLVSYEGIMLISADGKVLGSTLGIDEVTELGYSDGSFDFYNYGKPYSPNDVKSIVEE